VPGLPLVLTMQVASPHIPNSTLHTRKHRAHILMRLKVPLDIFLVEILPSADLARVPLLLQMHVAVMPHHIGLRGSLVAALERAVVVR